MMVAKSEYETLVDKYIKTFSKKEVIKSIIFGKSTLSKDVSSNLYNAPCKDKLFSLEKITKDCNFGMSSELAQAIGTVVVQALQENAKEDEEMNDLELEDSDYDTSLRDKGEDDSNEPLKAKDLSAEEEELSDMLSNNSFSYKGDESRYTKVKNILNGCF